MWKKEIIENKVESAWVLLTILVPVFKSGDKEIVDN